MQTLDEVLRDHGVQAAFADMGVDPATLFATELEENPYRDHRWIVKHTPNKVIVNAIPDQADLDHLFWEQWYTHRGQVHHQVLTLWQPSRHDGIFHAPAHDEEHPTVCSGKRWFVVEDTDLRPWLLRR